MPDVIRHPAVGRLGVWIPACAGMTGGYIASLFALTGLTVTTVDSEANSSSRLKPAFNSETLHCAVGCDDTDTMMLTPSL